MRIFLGGVSCVGKTTIGKQLAEEVEYKFFDLDSEVESYYGKKPIESYIQARSWCKMEELSYATASLVIISSMSRTIFSLEVSEVSKDGMLEMFWFPRTFGCVQYSNVNTLGIFQVKVILG